MRKKIYYFYIIVLFCFLFIPLLSAEQNNENFGTDSNIDAILGDIDKIYNERNLEKDIDTDIKKLKEEKEKLDSEINNLKINNNKLASETEDVNNIEIIENSNKMKKDIDDLYSQIVMKSNSSDSLSNRIYELDNDLKNEKAEINNSEYEKINDEIEKEKRKIIETGEQIKKRREETKKFKREIIVLDETLESYKIKDGLLGKVVEKYTTHFKAEIENKPDKSPKLVVLTQKVNPTSVKSKVTGLILKTNDTLINKFNDCLVQYYIPLDALKPGDIKYNFKDNCLIINSPKPVLDEEMLFIQVDPKKIDEQLPDGWFKGGITKELKDEIMSNIKEDVLRAGRNDRFYGEAEESARFHLENFFRGFMKGIKGSSDVKIKINFY